MEARPGADELWQLAVEQSPIGMSLVSLQGTILTANRSLCAMLGYSHSELTGTAVRDISHPDDIAADRDLLSQLLAGTITSARTDRRYRHADGSIVWADVSVTLVPASADNAPYLITHVVDVTELRSDREQLGDAIGVIDYQRRMSQAVFDAVGIGLVLLDGLGRYLKMNRRHHDFMELAFPEGHHDQAGQLGDVFAADGTTRLGRDEMPSTRAVKGEEFDDYRIWVGHDPLTRRSLSVTSRTITDEAGVVDGAVLAYSDITDLMRALAAREDFITTVSHELQTPLTAVRTGLEALLDSGELGASADHQLHLVQRNAERLRHLIADLLQTAHQRQGRLPLFPTPTDAAELVREVVAAARPSAEASSIELVADVDGPVDAVLDADRMRQVVDNVVWNALKYTLAGGRVEVRLVASEYELEFEVADTGIGIESADRDHLFTPFFRARRAQERAPGLGLGLGIARAIVEGHGGHIGVQSAVDRGSTFRITLPRYAVRTGGDRPDPPSV